MRTLQIFVMSVALSCTLIPTGCDVADEDSPRMWAAEGEFLSDDLFEDDFIQVEGQEELEDSDFSQGSAVPSCVACQYFGDPEDALLLHVLAPPVHAVPDVEPTVPDDPSVETPDDPAAPTVSNMLTVNGLDLYWELDGDLIHFKVMGETTGWIGVVFDPAYKLKGANLVLGYVDESGVTALDGYGIDATAFGTDTELGGFDDILDVKGQEIDGVTTLAFSLHVDSGDEFDNPFQPGEEMLVGIAAGANGEDGFDTPYAVLGFGVIRP